MDEFDWSILSVPTPRAVVRGQLEFSWWELGQRLETVTQDEFVWEPGPGALSVRRREESTAPRRFGVGEWVVEWPDSGDHPGPRTVAWLVAHLTDVLSERYDWTFGDHEARRETLTYSGEVGPGVAEATRVVDLWRARIAGMSDDDIFTVGFSQATEIDQQSPFAHLVAHINREIIHHGSEIFTLTDLYRVREEDNVSENHVARATVEIPASAGTVWDTLVDPDATWMLGARVTSTYVVGVPITFDGEWDGKPFQDHGEILEVDRPRRLRYTHYSPLSGQPDVPENYHHLTFTFEEHDGSTEVTLEQDGNGSAEEAEHATANWEQVLGALREAVVADAGAGSSS